MSDEKPHYGDECANAGPLPPTPQEIVQQLIRELEIAKRNVETAKHALANWDALHADVIYCEQKLLSAIVALPSAELMTLRKSQ